MPQKRTSEKEIVVSAAGTGAVPARSRRKASTPATRAKRPANSALDLADTVRAAGYEPRHWREALAEYVAGERSQP